MTKMDKIDLSIAIPSIRTENWPKIYQSIKESIGDYKFELIFCSDNKNISLKEDNIHWIEDKRFAYARSTTYFIRK